VAADGRIGYPSKRGILYNIKGFWNSLIALLDDLQNRGMVRGDWRNRIQVAGSLEEMVSLLES
ncbi:MAG: TIGR00730 family Rossman fold protein, partial [Prevotella sp.]|nr:TIGR00730 family Rossman fold protein [Prevotella sp.]